MGENKHENGTEEWPDAGGADPTPSLGRPVRHTFILRLIPTFKNFGQTEPRWHGELNLIRRGQNVQTQTHGDVKELIKSLLETIQKITKPT